MLTLRWLTVKYLRRLWQAVEWLDRSRYNAASGSRVAGPAPVSVQGESTLCWFNPFSGAVFRKGKGIPVRILKPCEFGATGSVPNSAFVLLHAGVPAELDTLGRKFIHDLLDSADLPAKDGELYGVVLCPYSHNPKFGARLRANAEDKGEWLVSYKPKS